MVLVSYVFVPEGGSMAAPVRRFVRCVHQHRCAAVRRSIMPAGVLELLASCLQEIEQINNTAEKVGTLLLYRSPRVRAKKTTRFSSF